MIASRRTFLKNSGALAASALTGATLSACGGGDDSEGGEMNAQEQLALTSSQAVAAIQNGSLSAEAYVTTLLARADALKDLNAFITLNRDGALTAARNIDAMLLAAH